MTAWEEEPGTSAPMQENEPIALDTLQVTSNPLDKRSLQCSKQPRHDERTPEEKRDESNDTLHP